MSTYVTKLGRHGTLYLHAVTYTDPSPGSGCPELRTVLWAYDMEHALDRFEAEADGWTALRVSRVRADGQAHREVQHASVEVR